MHITIGPEAGTPELPET